MNPQKHTELIEKLTAYDVAGTPYAAAKAELLVQGYDEADITHALYSAPFDGKPNKPRNPTPQQQGLAAHTEHNETIATGHLRTQAKEDWEHTVNHTIGVVTTGLMAAPAVGPHIEGQHHSGVVQRLHMPAYAYLIACLVLTFIGYKYAPAQHITQYVFYGLSAAMVILFVIRLHEQWKRTK